MILLHKKPILSMFNALSNRLLFKMSSSQKRVSHLINPYTGQLVSDKPYISEPQITSKVTHLSREQKQWRLIPLNQKIQIVDRFVRSILHDSKEQQYLCGIMAESIGKSYRDTQQELEEIKSIYPLLLESGNNFFKHEQTIFTTGKTNRSAEWSPESQQQQIPCAPRVLKKIIYSGSQSSAKHIFEELAESRFVDCNLFFGGQDAAYVDETADLQHTATQILNSSFANNGQSYDCIKRLYIHEQVHDQLVQLLTQKVATLCLGDPKDSEVDLGPLASPEAATKLQELVISSLLLQSQVSEAISYGARCQIGGLIRDDINQNQSVFFEPTLLTEVSSDMQIFQTQAPGPILCVCEVNSDDNFVSHVNDNKYGAGVRIFTKKSNEAEVLSRYQKIIDRLQVGKVVFNKGSLFTNNGPIEGWKASGKGKILSTMSFEEYSQPKVYNLKSQI